MRRHQDIRSLFALFLLTFSGSKIPSLGLAVDFAMDQQIHTEVTKPNPRCDLVDVPKSGRYWIVMSTDRPSTAPALIVLATDGDDPQTAGRVEATLLDVALSGTYVVCFTSDSDLSHGSWRLKKVDDPPQIFDEKSGDEWEIIEVPDP